MSDSLITYDAWESMANATIGKFLQTMGEVGFFEIIPRIEFRLSHADFRRLQQIVATAPTRKAQEVLSDSRYTLFISFMSNGIEILFTSGEAKVL